MIVALMVLAVVVVGVLTGVLVWLGGVRPGLVAAEAMSEPTSSAAHEPLGAVVTPAEVDGLRFDQTVRGYRMTQVDAVLDRLRDELAERDAEVARLRAELDAARVSMGGDPQLGQGPVIRPSDEDSLWSAQPAHPSDTVHDFQAGDRTDRTDRTDRGERLGDTPRDAAH